MSGLLGRGDRGYSGAVTVANGATLKVGDVLWIERPNDAALFKEIGDTLWQEDKPLRTAMVVVKAVNGNTVVLDRPLPFAFDVKTTTVAVADVVIHAMAAECNEAF